MARQIFRQEALDRLASPDLLDRPVRIVRPAGWLGLGLLLAAALIALVWTAMTTAPVKVSGIGVIQLAPNPSETGSQGHAGSAKALVAVLFVPSPDSWRVKTGMTVEIDLSTIRREEAGFLLGTVAEVSPTPVSRETLQQIFGDDRLVDLLSHDGVPIQTLVDLKPDNAATNGFRWSTARGVDIDLHPGTRLDGQIVVGHRSLLSLLIPGLGQPIDANGL